MITTVSWEILFSCYLLSVFSLSPSIQEGPDGLRRAVIPGGNLNSAPAACRMDDLPIADIHGYVVDRALAVGVEDQVARAHLTGLHSPSGLRLFSGGSRKPDTSHMA